MPENLSRFQEQYYHKLKRSCLRRGVLFQDPHFPPSAESLFYRRAPPPGLTWKRPKDLCRDPRLFVDGISTRDLQQGILGNCWMVAATSCLTAERSLWRKVIPHHAEQEWNPKRPDLYAGIFHFRFWRLGRWTDVVVDDRLPVSGEGTLLFCRSAAPREFWSALLEKAYAKLNGCYEALEGGNTAEALVDFTGGVSEALSLNPESLMQHPEQRKTLFHTLAEAHGRKALITCSIRPAQGEQAETLMDCGLVKGHAYGVTAVRRVRVTSGSTRVLLVRMRNPWGTANWSGSWSPGSAQWQRLSRRDRDAMGLVLRDVGEFWMEFGDFCCFFTDMVVCHLADESFFWPRSQWREVHCAGAWTRGDQGETGNEGAEGRAGGRGSRSSRCGGCINHTDTFLLNPQFLLEVRLGGEEVLLCLQQEDRRRRRRDGGGDNLPIGFELLRVEVNRTCRVQCVCEQAASSVYMDSRSVSLRVTLDPGRYVIVPTTFQPGSAGRFLLRCFSRSRVTLGELRADLPGLGWFRCCASEPRVVITVHLLRASGLSPNKHTAPDVFAVIRCEDQSVRTRVFTRDGNPEFNTKAIFYKQIPASKIRIELWRRRFLFDSFLGGAKLQTAEREHGRSRVIDLHGGQSQGCIFVETSSSRDLNDL